MSNESKATEGAASRYEFHGMDAYVGIETPCPSCGRRMGRSSVHPEWRAMTPWTPDRHSAAKLACEKATALSPALILQRYDHGGGRAYLLGDEQSGLRALVADFYDEANREWFWTARTDLPDALAEIERLTGVVGENTARLTDEESAHLETIDERDAFEERIDEIADALGDETEWSSDNDRSQNAVELAEEVLADNARLRSMLNSIVASTTDPAIKAMALRALEGAER